MAVIAADPVQVKALASRYVSKRALSPSSW